MGGISKNRVKQALGAMVHANTWRLILVLIPLLFLTVLLLRFAHLGMAERREKVLELDASGDMKGMVAAVNELKSYTFSHIVVNVVEENGVERVIFGTGPFYLEQQYVRTAQAELAKAEQAAEEAGNNPNGNVFKKAADVCDRRAVQNGWGAFNAAYVRCIQTELAKYPVSEEIAEYERAMIPSTALYRLEFVSPFWYPSWAGVAMLLCLLLGVVIIIRLLIWVGLQITLLVLKNK